MEKSYVSNTYFEKNREKYTKVSENDSDPARVFALADKGDYDPLKIPHLPNALDNFFTRYVYHSFTRWCTRFGQFLGITKET